MSKKVGNISVYINAFKHEDSAQPDYRGKLTVEGYDYDLALWVNLTTIAGSTINLSGQVTLPED